MPINKIKKRLKLSKFSERREKLTERKKGKWSSRKGKRKRNETETSGKRWIRKILRHQSTPVSVSLIDTKSEQNKIQLHSSLVFLKQNLFSLFVTKLRTALSSRKHSASLQVHFLSKNKTRRVLSFDSGQMRCFRRFCQQI